MIGYDKSSMIGYNEVENQTKTRRPENVVN